MKVFKYVSQYGPEILQTRKIYASKADELNDPFELSPCIDTSQFTPRRAGRFLRLDHEIDAHYKKEGRKLGFTNKKEYKRFYLSTLRSRAAALLPKVPENVEEVRRNFAKTFSQFWRMFCVSRRNDSILMWSHYAENHTGAVIEFDLSFSPFKWLASDYISPVKYSCTKADFIYSTKEDDFKASLLNVARTKSMDWAYEDEVRILFPYSACSREHFIEIEPKAIKWVYLGCRVTEEYKNNILSALSSIEMIHVGVSQASLSKKSYGLEFTITHRP